MKTTLDSSTRNDSVVPVVCGIGIFRFPSVASVPDAVALSAQRTLVLVSNNLRVDGLGGTIRDHPFNVAVRGDHLEKLHFKIKRNFLQLDVDSIPKLFRRPFELFEVKVAALLLFGYHVKIIPKYSTTTS